jgi:type IV pilus assembly protein PilO
MKFITELIRTRRNWLVVIAFLAMADVGLYGFYLLKQSPEADRAHVKLFEKSRLLSSAGTSDQTSVYTQGKADLASFSSAIPPKKDFARTVGDIYEAAARNALSVGGTTFKPAAAGEAGFVSYLLSMNVTGKYPGIKSFLSQLQSLPQSMIVEKVSLAGGSGKGSEEIVNLRLDLTLFLQKEGQ